MAALYIGNQKVTPSLGEMTSWWSGKNPKLLYEATYNQTLANMSWADIDKSTAAVAMNYPATTESASGTTVIFDQWGIGYHNGTALDFGQYNYFILEDHLVDIHYTTAENTMGKIHALKYTQTSGYFIGQQVRMASGNQLIYPTDMTYGTTTALAFTYQLQWRRNASNNLAVSNAAYGLYTSVQAPTFQTTSSLICNYINFRVPTWSHRAHNSYHILDASNLIDANNTTLKVRHRLYQINKAGFSETMTNRFGYMFENNSFPAEII